MSEKPQPQQQGSDEIDLGQLFQMIGNGFKKFFNFIGDILGQLFHILMVFLIFLQKHFLKFVAVVIIGFGLGYFLDTIKTTKYISTMVVEPNFNSVEQLYNNVEFFDELADAKDSVALAEVLNISVPEAATIKKVEVASFTDDNQKVKLFDKFIRELDTTTRKNIDMAAYLENFNAIDARFHTITMTASDNRVAKKTQPAIIRSIANNEYYQLQKRIYVENIKLQDSIYRKQLVEVDSLQGLYKRVMEKEAAKEMQGTNISLGENGASENKELALIRQQDQLRASLVQLNEQRVNKSNILNVISDFPRKGAEVKGIWVSYKFLLPIVLVGLTLVVLSLLSLNRYLNRYQEKQKA